MAPKLGPLNNYDTNRDNEPGLVIARGGSGAGEANPQRFQSWRTAPLASATTLGSNVTVHLWSGMKDFEGGKAGRIEVYLRDFNGSSYTEICSGALADADWQGGPSGFRNTSFSFACPTYTLSSGHSLELKLIVDGSSEDDLWFAYDTNPYRSRIQIN